MLARILAGIARRRRCGHRPEFFWFVTFQSSSRCDTECDIDVTTSLSSDTSAMPTRTTAFCIRLSSGRVAKRELNDEKSSAVSSAAGASSRVEVI